MPPPTARKPSSTSPAIISVVSLLIGYCLGRLGGGDPTTTTTESVLCARGLEEQNEVKEEPSKELIPASSKSLDSIAPGWHSVHVYYGDRDHLLKEGLVGVKEFSQEGQDKYVLEVLGQKRNGFFVDLASNHPIRLSNTFLLERDYNWNGLCIEPNWQYWNGLASLRRCQVVAAVGGGAVSQAIQFRFHPFKRFQGALGGIVGDEFVNKPNDKKQDDILEETRFTVALAEILETFEAPKTIDYLSLDVEGAEELILTDFPFDNYMFRVMNVERPNKKLKDLFQDSGYELLRTDKYGDTIWKHKSVP